MRTLLFLVTVLFTSHLTAHFCPRLHPHQVLPVVVCLSDAISSCRLGCHGFRCDASLRQSSLPLDSTLLDGLHTCLVSLLLRKGGVVCVTPIYTGGTAASVAQCLPPSVSHAWLSAAWECSVFRFHTRWTMGLSPRRVFRPPQTLLATHHAMPAFPRQLELDRCVSFLTPLTPPHPSPLQHPHTCPFFGV